MRRVTANDFKVGKWMDYSADGIRIINDVRQIPRSDLEAFTVDMVIVYICMQGKVTVSIDDKKYTITRNKLLILMPNTTVGSYKWSDDFVGKALAVSLQTIESSIYLRSKVWDSLTYLHQNPVVPLTAEDLQVFRHYYGIATSHNVADPVYKHEIISHQIKSIIYEYLSIIDCVMRKKGQTVNLKQSSNDDLYRRFLELLAFSSGHIRKVSQYAERLSVTPKHLAAVVKSISGRTVIEWINESTIKAITNELCYTQKTISEIAQEFDFPSLSFFGKYFKKHTGFSPRAYREQLEESVP